MKKAGYEAPPVDSSCSSIASSNAVVERRARWSGGGEKSYTRYDAKLSKPQPKQRRKKEARRKEGALISCQIFCMNLLFPMIASVIFCTIITDIITVNQNLN